MNQGVEMELGATPVVSDHSGGSCMMSGRVVVTNRVKNRPLMERVTPAIM